jgi:hypothetical protein
MFCGEGPATKRNNSLARADGFELLEHIPELSQVNVKVGRNSGKCKVLFGALAHEVVSKNKGRPTT